MSFTLHVGRPDDSAAEPPTWEIPAVLPREMILTRSDDIVISVGDVHVYSRGVLASFYVRFDPEHDPSNLAELQDFTSDFQKVLDPEGLIMGIDAGDDGAPALRNEPRGRQGSDRLWRLSYWAFPLPRRGIVYSAQWLSQGLPLGSATVSADEVSTLLGQVIELRSPRRA